MYIAEVITVAKKLYPTEYSLREYLMWCDELSAEIMRNYDISYHMLEGKNGELTLPEGVTINDISRIEADGRIIKKTDIRDKGFAFEYGRRGIKIREHMGRAKSFRVYYALPYTPIRYIDEDATIHILQNSFETSLDIRDGDCLRITIGDTEYSCVVESCKLGICTIKGDTLPEGEQRAHIYRELTDKTKLDAPYDTAYIDFVNAKAALYQGDKNAYTSHMSQFNSKLADYSNYITRNKPRTKAKFYNWY